MPKKTTKPPLSLEDWLSFMETQGDFWKTEEAKEGLEAWYEYKDIRGELFVSTIGLKAIVREFKDKEACFLVSVYHRINENKHQGLFKCEWLAEDELMEQRAERKRTKLAALGGGV